MADPRIALTEREHALDESVEGLRLWALPRRAVLTLLYSTVYSLMHGPVDGQAGGRAEGEALMSRLSFLARLIARCPELPMGASAADVTSIVTGLHASELQEAVLYAHACEIFPEVRKGWYEVSVRDAGFVLDQPEGAVREAEERDVLLSEIAVPAWIGGLPENHPARSKILIPPAAPRDTPKCNEKFLLLPALHYAAMETLESNIVDDDAMLEIAGITVSQFQRFQRAAAALALTCLDLAKDAGRLARAATRARDRELWREEQMEWYAPCLGAEFVKGMLAELAGLDDSELDSVLALFTFGEDGAPAGEGYWPPLWFFDGENGEPVVMFSPDLLLHMTAQRNVVYVFSKTNKAKFDSLVSHRLEPALLDIAEQQLQRDPSLVVRRNVGWEAAGLRGEFDLLIYDPRENSVCHLQAKAPVPPQGARMVDRLEGRVTEGLSQLRRFHDLPTTERDRIVSAAVDLPLKRPTLHEVVMTRTSFGTARVWNALEGAVPANPPLLKGALDALFAENGEARLSEAVERLARLLDDMVGQAAPRWEHQQVVLGGPDSSRLALTIPLLRLDARVIQQCRLRLAPRLAPN